MLPAWACSCPLVDASLESGCRASGGNRNNARGMQMTVLGQSKTVVAAVIG